jgi:hypothetical protein
METKEKNYLFLILLHVAIGVLIYSVPFLSKIYGFIIILAGMYFVIKTGNRNNEVLYAAAYIVGSEVFLRMTGGSPSYEVAKYGVIIFSFMGMFYSGFSKNAVPYWIFLLLLIPSVIISTEVLNLSNRDIRKTIFFNISGPVSLGIASLYTYNRKITIGAVNNILLVLGLPIISCAVYLFLFTPNIKDVLTGTGSNNELSGGFGPNQVATILGLGMFIFFSRLILASRTKLIFIVNLIFAAYISYRGMLTFSRGGMITGFVMIIIMLLFIYFNSKEKGKVKLKYMIIFLFISMTATWLFTSYQTGGFIDKRYANEDALGRAKKDNFTGRGEIAEGEIAMFLESPIFGVGVAKGSEIRSEQMGLTELFASHDEITRMLAEHGTLGILALLILFFTPIFLYLDNRQHIYLFSFLLFWLLTINHAAMRTAAPSFIYALALLKVKLNDDEEPIVHRK